MPKSLPSDQPCMFAEATSLIDTHCHLDFLAFDLDREEVLQQCLDRHITTIIIPGIHQKQWLLLLDFLCQSAPIQLLGAVGMHPFFLDKHNHAHLKELRVLLEKHPQKFIAVGEIGIDLFESRKTLELQEALFIEQLKIAKECKKPVIIHSRKAHDIICKHLRESKFSYGGVIHAFSGSEQQANAFIQLGFYLGIGGAITWPRSKKLRYLVSTLPLTTLVLETDAPDMPLQGQQGQRNTPVNLIRILDELCILRKESREEIIFQLKINSHKALQFS